MADLSPPFPIRDMYHKTTIEAVEQGWIVTYYNAGEHRRVFTDWDELMSFVASRLTEEG